MGRENTDQVRVITALNGPGPKRFERVILDIDENDVLGHGALTTKAAAPVIGLQFVKVERAEIREEGGENKRRR